MVKIEAPTLEEAYKKASSKLRCSASELQVEVVQQPSLGVFGLFKKNAIIIAVHNQKQYEDEEIYEEEEEYYNDYDVPVEKERAILKKEKKHPVVKEHKKVRREEVVKKRKPVYEEEFETEVEVKEVKPKKRKPVYETKKFDDEPEIKVTPKKRVHREKRDREIEPKIVEKVTSHKRERVVPKKQHKILNDTIMPTSFVSDQDDEYEDLSNGLDYTADYDDEYDNQEIGSDIQQTADSISEEINALFDLTCFNIDSIDVSVYDENTVLVNFRGSDSALLIGKEGYRYKAISYMIFNWINTKYDVQLRLEIAEFLKNQEESVDRYILSVQEIVEREGRAQTKILDGVLIQIALRKLRDIYPDKYVVIRTTRDGNKYIIINEYHA